MLSVGILPHDLLSQAFGTPLKTPAHEQDFWVSRFFMWDSDWYDSIARQGYSWHPANGQAENIAFFPLWPMILYAISLVTGDGYAYRVCVFMVTASIGFASVFAFGRLSRELLPPATARWAIAFYAFNPAANFLFRSYPVGLINLLAALCLYELLKRRYWQAAALGGLASGAGPLAVCLSIAVIFAAAFDLQTGVPALFRNKRLFYRNAGWLVGIGLVSLSGLIAFCGWSVWAFHDPAPFIAAQRSWGMGLPFLKRVVIFLKLESIVPDFSQAAKALWDVRSMIRLGHGAEAETRLQNAIGYTGLAAALIGGLSCFRLRPCWLALQGLLVISGYVWLIATNLGGYATLRLIYPALPCCLGMALLFKGRPALSGFALGLSGLTMMFEEYLAVSGYWVI